MCCVLTLAEQSRAELVFPENLLFNDLYKWCEREQLNDQVRNVLPALPVGLQEALVRLLSRDPRKRPTAQLLSGIKFFRYLLQFHPLSATVSLSVELTKSPMNEWNISFSHSDPVVHALQFLDVINMKDPSQKSHFYRATLTDILPAVPKVRSCPCNATAIQLTNHCIALCTVLHMYNNTLIIFLSFYFFARELETLVSARLAEFAAGAQDPRGACSRSAAHFAHDSGYDDWRVSSVHHANHQVYYISSLSSVCLLRSHSTPLHSTALWNWIHYLFFWIMFNFRQILGVPKSIQASVTLLENLHIIVDKTPSEDLHAEILPMLFSSFESTTLQVQVPNQ